MIHVSTATQLSYEGISTDKGIENQSRNYGEML